MKPDRSVILRISEFLPSKVLYLNANLANYKNAFRDEMIEITEKHKDEMLRSILGHEFIHSQVVPTPLCGVENLL